MLKEEQVLNIFRRVGAILTGGHFVYTSGKHGSVYFNKDAIYVYSKEVSKLCEAMAVKFLKDGVEIVIAPAVGGIILSQWVAYHLSRMSGEEVLSVYAEKERVELVSSRYGPLPLKIQDKFVIKRSYDKLVAG
ncbi:MAG: orotate phosphoribosyltransferase, partial [Parcubacteria group bacterium Athens1014_26]